MPSKSSNKTSSSRSKKPSIETSPIKHDSGSTLVSAMKIFGVLIILTFFLVSGLFVFAIVEPESSLGKWVDNDSPIADYFSLNNTSNNDNNNSTTSPSLINNTVEEPKSTSPVNDLLGLNVANEGVTFANPTGSLTVSETVEKVLPSVVSIRVSSQGSMFGSASAGSGYFVTQDGLIVTNKHVIALACSNNVGEINITGLTHDQKAYNLELLSVDPIEDIAILRAEKENDSETFPAVEIANSQTLKLGNEVIAIGNTLGELQNTVTKGIVSGLDRSLGQDTPFDSCTGRATLPESLIQTDAAINQGNSGGPLFNASGQLIGMNTYGIPNAQNIGLAIPSVRIRAALDSYLENGIIVRPRLGILSTSITPLDAIENDWLPVDYGELIFSGSLDSSPISEGSAADEAGLKNGDIILEVNGNRIQANNNDPSPLRSVILNLQSGNNITLLVLRSTGIEDNTFIYENEPELIEVTLGGTSFELNQFNEN